MYINIIYVFRQRVRSLGLIDTKWLPADSMSTLSGLVSKGEKGKSKFQSLDINSLYRVSRVSWLNSFVLSLHPYLVFPYFCSYPPSSFSILYTFFEYICFSYSFILYFYNNYCIYYH